jgi:anaerobic magnesium-protoporphyrin IX monomethyl ester cyclase
MISNQAPPTLRVAFYCARYPDQEMLTTPLGIASIAAYLDQRFPGQVETCIVDAFSELRDFAPDIIGVSSTSQVFHHARSFITEARASFPQAKIILGGYQITAAPQTLPIECLAGVLGEGEETTRELVESLLLGHVDDERLVSIPGLALRIGDKIVTTQPRPLIQDLNALPDPVRHRNYGPDTPIMTSRGCPYRCSFCASPGFWQQKVRWRTAESVVSEINRLVATIRPKSISILDDLWMANKPRFRAIVDGLTESGVPKNVSFRGFCRSNIIHEEDILLMLKMNYRVVRFGAETGSSEHLRRLKGPGISIEDHQRVIDLCAKHGMRCTASFMFGAPGETMEDIEQTVSFLIKNRGKFGVAGFYLFNPIPGTALWDNLEARQLISSDFDLSSLSLDMKSKDFNWTDPPYFNGDNVPWPAFRAAMLAIGKRF